MKKEKLHDLIHSMNKSEKRYFQLYSNVTGDSDGKKYLKIFDSLHSMKVYDESKFKTLLKEKGLSLKNLGSDKAYLYQHILKSLWILNGNNQAKSEAREWLSNSDILFLKGLYEQSLNACKKAKKIVEHYNLISLMPDVLLTERKVSYYLNLNISNEENKSIIKDATKRIDEYIDSDYLYREVISLLKEIGVARLEEEFNRFNSLQESIENLDCKELHSIIRQKQSLAAIHYSKGEFLKEYEKMTSILEIMDKNPNFKNENVYEYIVFFSHVLRLSKKVDLNNYQQLLNEFFRIGELVKKNKLKIQSQVYSLGYSTETVRLLEMGLFEEGIELIPTIQNLEKKYGNLISRSVYMTFEYKFAYFYFGVGNLTTSLKYINNVINNYNEIDRRDVYRYTKIFSLIIHYELGNYSLISYNLRSLQTFLKKRNLLYASENVIIKCIRLLPRTRNKEEKSKLLEETKRVLLSNFELNPREKNILVYFDIISWLDSKLLGIPFQEAKMINVSKS